MQNTRRDALATLHPPGFAGQSIEFPSLPKTGWREQLLPCNLNVMQRLLLFALAVSTLWLSTPIISGAAETNAEDATSLNPPVVSGREIWKDASQPVDARVNDLVSRMSLAEKVAADAQHRAGHSAAGRAGL